MDVEVVPEMYVIGAELPLDPAASVGVVTVPAKEAVFVDARLDHIFVEALKLVMSYHATSPDCRKRGIAGGGGGGDGGGLGGGVGLGG